MSAIWTTIWTPPKSHTGTRRRDNEAPRRGTVVSGHPGGNPLAKVERKTPLVSLGVPLGRPLRSGGQAPEADALSAELQAREPRSYRSSVDRASASGLTLRPSAVSTLGWTAIAPSRAKNPTNVSPPELRAMTIPVPQVPELGHEATQAVEHLRRRERGPTRRCGHRCEHVPDALRIQPPLAREEVRPGSGRGGPTSASLSGAKRRTLLVTVVSARAANAAATTWRSPRRPRPGRRMRSGGAGASRNRPDLASHPRRSALAHDHLWSQLST